MKISAKSFGNHFPFVYSRRTVAFWIRTSGKTQYKLNHKKTEIAKSDFFDEERCRQYLDG